MGSAAPPEEPRRPQGRRRGSCWGSIYTAKRCCDWRAGPSGLEDCWDGAYGYEHCCTLERPPRDREPQLRRLDGWCGPVCVDSSEGKDRHWEAMRYQTLAALSFAGSHPERELLALVREAVETLVADFPWDLLEQVATPLCPVGALTLRLARGVALARSSLSEAIAVAHDLISQPQLMLAAFCSGWPLFRMLALAAVNATCEAAPFTRNINDLSLRFFDGSRVDWSPDSALQWTHGQLKACMRLASAEACLGASVHIWHDLHASQGATVLGAGVCPPGSFAVWLDRMDSAPFALCARSEYNLIDDEIRRRGSWQACRLLAELARDPGCHVIDVGANIGACTVMLARLGHHVTAFEPLQRNVQLLQASLKLNRLTATVHALALGEHRESGFILEGRWNAGMSVVVPGQPVAPCDDRTFHCERIQKVRISRLDDIMEPQEICVVKIDAEGSELKVLRGAVSMLREGLIRVIYLEWWPPHLVSLGEEPLSLLHFLHAMHYEIFAPAEWIPGQSKQLGWVMIVPDQFDFLLERWGELVARFSG